MRPFLVFAAFQLLILTGGLAVAGVGCRAIRCDASGWPSVAVILSIGLLTFTPLIWFTQVKQ